MSNIYWRIFFRSNYLLFSICLFLVIIGTYSFYTEFGMEGLLSRDYKRLIAMFFVPLVVKVFSNFIFHNKKEKKILAVFSTLLNRHRIIEIEYPNISNDKLLQILESFKSFYNNEIKIIYIESGYLVLGKMNVFKKILGENDDFYIETIDSGFKIYLNSIGGKTPIYKYCEEYFGVR